MAILNRFHAMAMFEKALNEVHVSDACRLKLEDGDETPKHCRWCLLNRSESFTDKQAVELPELLRTNQKTVRAYFMREDS